MPWASLGALAILIAWIGAPWAREAPRAEPVYGVTVDSVAHLDPIVESLRNLSKRPTVRIVFDRHVPPGAYQRAVTAISPIGDIMGEILDSAAVPEYSVDAYKARTVEYLDAFPSQVRIWEVGNEVNGEWLGLPADVARKVLAAHEVVKSRGGRTAITFHYNEGCFARPGHEVFAWAERHLPPSTRESVDYALLSYYEENCAARPDWLAAFRRLSALFPNSKIGFGEVGSPDPAKKAETLRRYYTTKVDHPSFIGGYFWWYYRQDMVPMTRPLWHVLNEVIAGS